MSLLKEISSEISRMISELRKVFRVESIDVLIAQSEVREINGVKVVMKKFTSEIGLLKWLPPAIFLKVSYPFALTPKERFEREMRFMSFSGWEGFKVPRILNADHENLIVIREYVEGEPLSCDRRDNVVALGRILAEVHSKGFCLGDVKPTNFITNREAIYVIDAEQSVYFREELGSWDLMVATFFISLANYMNIDMFQELFEEFSRSYLESGGLMRSYCDMLSPRNAVLATFIPLPNLVVISNIRKKYCQ